jgi:DNA-binding transcriptional LysR family regulator
MQVKKRAVLGQISDMDLRLLRVFRSVVECGGMAAAELELNIATSTISRHIKDLETRLGLTLCRRGVAALRSRPRASASTPRRCACWPPPTAFAPAWTTSTSAWAANSTWPCSTRPPATARRTSLQAVALFRAQAPEVALNLHVGSLNLIERGVMDGQFQLGIIPEHRRSDSLAYDELFGETMLLYCGAAHPLFEAGATDLTWERLRSHDFAGLGYHSPNMEIAHRERLRRDATGFDQESVATLILSGRFLGFLPDHYAEAFVRAGQMRAVQPELFRYACRFSGITRRSPAPSRVTQLLRDCLVLAHINHPAPEPCPIQV